MQPNTSVSPSEPSEIGLTTGILNTSNSQPDHLKTVYDHTVEAFLDGKNLTKKFLEMERVILQVALHRCHWNKSQAAKLCGLRRTCLIEKCRKFGLMERPVDP